MKTAAVLLWHVDAHGCLFPAGIPKGVALAFLGELSETILQGRYKKGAASSARPMVPDFSGSGNRCPTFLGHANISGLRRRVHCK